MFSRGLFLLLNQILNKTKSHWQSIYSNYKQTINRSQYIKTLEVWFIEVVFNKVIIHNDVNKQNIFPFFDSNAFTESVSVNSQCSKKYCQLHVQQQQFLIIRDMFFWIYDNQDKKQCK